MPKLSLHFAPQACSRVTLICLEKCRAEYTTELVVFMRGGHRNPAYLKLNPAGKVPLLLVDDTPISQNPAIISWLDHTYPNARLLAETKSDVSRAGVFSDLIRFSADLHPLVTRIRMPQLICDDTKCQSRVQEMAMEAMAFQLTDYEHRLARQPWLNGAGWGALDAYLHWVWFRIIGAGFDGSRFPAIDQHHQRTHELPEVIRALSIEAEAQSYLEENGLAPRIPDLSKKK